MSIDAITHVINEIPTGIGTGAIFAFLVTVTMQPVKNYFKREEAKVHKDWFFAFLTAVLTFVPIAIDYLGSAIKANPGIIGSRFAAVFTLTQAIYFFPMIGIKSLSTINAEAKAQRAVPASATETPTVTEFAA